MQKLIILLLYNLLTFVATYSTDMRSARQYHNKQWSISNATTKSESEGKFLSEATNLEDTVSILIARKIPKENLMDSYKKSQFLLRIQHLQQEIQTSIKDESFIKIALFLLNLAESNYQNPVSSLLFKAALLINSYYKQITYPQKSIVRYSSLLLIEESKLDESILSESSIKYLSVRKDEPSNVSDNPSIQILTAEKEYIFPLNFDKYPFLFVVFSWIKMAQKNEICEQITDLLLKISFLKN